MELILNGEVVELVHDSGNWLMKRGIGFSAVEMVVNSAGACGLYVFSSILKNSKIDAIVQRAHVSYTVDETTSVRALKTISIEYKVQVEESLKPRVERVLPFVHRNCPVMQSLDPKIEVIETIIYS